MEGLIDREAKKWQVYLHDMKIEDEGIRYLCSKQTQTIQDLWLSNNKLTFRAVHAFSQSNWANLSLLVFSNNRIGSKGCFILSKCSLDRLSWLNLSSNFIENSGAIHLSKANWPKISQCYLARNKISEGIEQLMLAHWPAIRLISLNENNVFQCHIVNLMRSEKPECCFEIQNQLKFLSKGRVDRLRDLTSKKQKPLNSGRLLLNSDDS